MLARTCSILIISSMALLALASSCSPRAAEGIPLTEQELPDMILRNANYTLGRPDEDPLRMKAGTITIYSTAIGTIMEDVSFTGGNGLQGSCDRATITSDMNQAVLEGNVIIDKPEDNITITAQSIRWNNDSMTISTDGQVSIRYEDGTQIIARGFSAKLDENMYEFSEIIEGRFEE